MWGAGRGRSAAAAAHSRARARAAGATAGASLFRAGRNVVRWPQKAARVGLGASCVTASISVGLPYICVGLEPASK
eukprot:COSAG02_NODE_282_length_25773_cov_1666.149762_15_plen_76_part_00